MPTKTEFKRVAASLMLFTVPLFCGAQTQPPSLESFISQTVSEAETLKTPTIGEWAIHHPDETVDAPDIKDSDNDQQNARSVHNRELQGRWCLRSTTNILLDGGIYVHRTALFYQPLVEKIWDKPLPPLPTESGDALRQHGCGLAKILYEFYGVTDPQKLFDTLAKLIPGDRSEEPGNYIVDYQGKDYWKPAYSFDNIFRYGYIYDLYVSKSKDTRPDEQPTTLLEWKGGILEYGQPSKDTVNPEAGQPWLALRAAKLAQLPEVPTLDMLSFLAPQVGDSNEQPPFYCDRQLIPVLRKWMALAAQSKPEQHAAALLLANEVLGRLSECEEFAEEPFNSSFETDDEWDNAHDSLEKDLKELGIETWKSARPGPEQYAGNLLAQVPKLAPTGPVNELYRMAILDDRCVWSQITELDCTIIIKEGESFLSSFPQDEWTPSVHLILAEAYTLSSAVTGGYSPTPDPEKTALEKKAEVQYRAWYAKSKNQRDRALVWEEIWALDAGMGPWLNLPWVYQQ